MYVQSCIHIKLCIFTFNLFCKGNTDYGDGPYSITLPAGRVDVLFNISIHDDNILENNETFSLLIVSNSLPDRVTIGKYNQSTVTILDSDSK